MSGKVLVVAGVIVIAAILAAVHFSRRPPSPAAGTGAVAPPAATPAAGALAPAPRRGLLGISGPEIDRQVALLPGDAFVGLVGPLRSSLLAERLTVSGEVALDQVRHEIPDVASGLGDGSTRATLEVSGRLGAIASGRLALDIDRATLGGMPIPLPIVRRLVRGDLTFLDPTASGSSEP